MPLVENKTKLKLKNNELALGFGVHHLRTSATAMLAAAADHDWLFIDMEHGAHSVHEATQLCHSGAADRRHADRALSAPARSTKARAALDNGALGVIVPHVDTRGAGQGNRPRVPLSAARHTFMGRPAGALRFPRARQRRGAGRAQRGGAGGRDDRKPAGGRQRAGHRRRRGHRLPADRHLRPHRRDGHPGPDRSPARRRGL